MAKHLLDSNILIGFLRREDRAQAILQALVASEVPSISVLSIFEVRLGMRSHEVHGTEQLLRSLEAVPVDERIAGIAADLGRPALRSGRTIDPIDLHIAATCLALDFTLVTYNIKDFRFPGLALYPIPK